MKINHLRIITTYENENDNEKPLYPGISARFIKYSMPLISIHLHYMYAGLILLPSGRSGGGLLITAIVIAIAY